MGCDGVVRFEVLVAESPSINDRVFVHDGDGESGGVPVLEDAGESGVETGEGIGF
jgi:hypothetical protein